MSGGRFAVLAIAMAALACASIALVSFVLARVVQEPLPQLHGRAATMAPAQRPTLVVVGVKPSGGHAASFRGTALFLIDRHGFRRVGYLFPLQPNFVAPACSRSSSSGRLPASGRWRC